VVKTADQKRLDEEFYKRYDKLITSDKEVVAKSNRLMGGFSIFIGLESLMLWFFSDSLNSLPNSMIYKIALGIINIAVAIYMVRFVVHNKDSL
jgi:hypothetical protein